MFRKFKILMSPNGDGGNAGGGDGGGAGAGAGGNSGGAASQSGGGLPSLTGNAGGGEGANNGAGSSSNASAGGAQNTVQFPANWKDGLPAELRSEPSLGAIQDIPALVKSFVHAQKAIGADKIVVPGKHATLEDIKSNVLRKIGLPEKLEDYKIEYDDKTLDKEFMGEFVKTAYEKGILPAQAQEMVKWFTTTEGKVRERVQANIREQRNAATAKLREEWGDKFDRNFNAAKTLVEKYADKELQEFMTNNGMATDPRVIRLLGRIGEALLQESDLPAGGAGGGSMYTPAQALAEMNKVYGDPKHPYFHADHPNHAAAVAEMTRLSAMATKKG